MQVILISKSIKNFRNIVSFHIFIWQQLISFTLENFEIVLKAFKDSPQPLKGGEVAELTGLDKKEVDKAIKKLKEDGLIDSPKRCYYAAK